MLFKLLFTLMLLVAPSLQMDSREPLPSYQEAVHPSRIQSRQSNNRLNRGANVQLQPPQDKILYSTSLLAIPEDCRKDTFFFYVIPKQPKEARGNTIGEMFSADINRINFGGTIITFSDKRTVAYTAVDELLFGRQYYIDKELVLKSESLAQETFDDILHFGDQDLRLTNEDVGLTTKKHSFVGTDGHHYSWKTIGKGFLNSKVKRIDLVRYPQKETVASLTFDLKLGNGLLEGKLVVQTNKIPENMLNMVVLTCAEANDFYLKEGNNEGISPGDVARFMGELLFRPRPYWYLYYH